MIYYISDTHFGHANIIKYCNRPFASVLDMDRAMIDRWNSRVTPEDTVYHLGDFGFGPLYKLQYFFAQLNGTIHLIKGNHDWGKLVKKLGFASIQKTLVIKDNGLTVAMAHIPGQFDYRNVDVMLHGHTHDIGLRQSAYKTYNLSGEHWDYTPVTLNEILEKGEK